MIRFRRLRSRLAAFAAAATVCAAAAAVPVAASPASAAAGPTSVSAGPGCPAGMLAWLPGATAVASGNPQEVAPGDLSAQAQASFGAQVLSLLAGQQVSWLGSTGCGQAATRSGPSRAAAPGGVGQPRAAHPAASIPLAPSNNWSGFKSDATHFTGASMTWTVPVLKSTASPAAVSIWPGIGRGDSGDKLIQAGTEQGLGGATIAWTEVVPGELQQQIKGMSVSAGDQVAVNVGWDKSTGTAAFLFVNYSTHHAKEVTEPVTGSSGSSAEWIIERTEACGNGNCVPGTFPHLFNFGQIAIANAAAEQTASGSTVTKYISGFGMLLNEEMQACAGSPTLATASGLDTQGDFLDTFDNANNVVDPGHCEWTISPPSAAFHGDLASHATAVLFDKAAALSITCQQATMSGTTGPSQVPNQPVATISASAFAACADTKGGVWSAHLSSGSTWFLEGRRGQR